MTLAVISNGNVCLCILKYIKKRIKNVFLTLQYYTDIFFKKGLVTVKTFWERGGLNSRSFASLNH